MKNKIIKLLLAMIVASSVISFASTTAYCMTDDEWYQTDSGQLAIREGLNREQWNRLRDGNMSVDEYIQIGLEAEKERRSSTNSVEKNPSTTADSSKNSSSNSTTSTTTVIATKSEANRQYTIVRHIGAISSLTRPVV